MRARDDGKRELERAFERLEDQAPDRLSRAIRWLRSRRARRVRLPIGVLFLAGGCLWFLPVLGLEMLPIGLLLLAVDIPFLRKPVARGTLWLEDRLGAVKGWWRERRGTRPRQAFLDRGERRA